VSEIKVPPIDAQAEESKRIDEALKSRTADDLNSQYVMQLRNDYGVSINESALSQVSGGGQQNY
jgi:peptidyl-prolyl cis-trans isomerase D